jgi:hypothetical protein
MANWTATLAAVQERGPRCDHCDGWTFRPEYNLLPRFIARLCPDCFPLSKEFRNLVPMALTLSQIFKSDLPGITSWPVIFGPGD